MSLTTGKIAEVMFENAKETYEHQMQMLPLVSLDKPESAQMQNSGNIIWRPRQQHAPIIEGWDVTGEETKLFWERRGKQSGLRQATELNKLIASAIALQGTLFYRSNAASGYDFIGEAQAQFNERQLVNNGRTFMLNDRDALAFGSDLAGRQTIQGRPEDAWAKGQIAGNVAEFDVYTGSFLPNLAGGAATNATVTGNQSFAPEGGSISATGVVTNVDCRIASIPVSASGSYNVGDKVTISNSGTPVTALGLADKNDTGQSMTFSIVGKPDSTTIQVYPKPIAADDSALSTLEKAYANIDTVILNAATVNRINTDASAKTNIFWDKEAIEVIGGDIPADLFASFEGKKVITDTLSNGLNMYMLYDGDIATMNFRYRLFVWYGITVCAPQACGTAVTY